MSHLDDKEILVDDEEESPLADVVEENLVVDEEIHLFAVQEISFVVKVVEVYDGEKLISVRK